MATPAPVHIMIQPRWLRRFLTGLVTIVSLLGLVAEVAYTLVDRNDPYGLVSFVGLSYERNLPTWVAACLLFTCAILLSLIARATQLRGGPWCRHWYALAGVFTYISLDEATQIHEEWSDWVHAGGGVLYYDWIIPAAVIVLILALIYCKFLWRLPVLTRRRFVLAAVLYIGGALFMELPLGYWADLHGSSNLVYGLIDWTEETLELAGVSVFLYALVLHLLPPPAGLNLVVAATPEPGAGRDTG